MVTLRERDGIDARALEFLVLTAARTGDVLGLVWDEIDLGKKLWSVPAARMKAKRAHVVPLSDRAVQILKSLPCEDGNPHVFIGARRPSLSHNSLFNLLKAMRPDVTVHGFRSAFRTWAGETTNYPREVAEMALAHSVGSAVEKSYMRGDL